MKNKCFLPLLLSLIMVVGCKDDNNSSSFSSTISNNNQSETSINTSKDSSSSKTTSSSSKSSSSSKPSSSSSSDVSNHSSSSSNNDTPTINKTYSVSIRFEEEAAWLKYYLNWEDNSLDISNIKYVGAIDGTIEFSHFLVSETIDNDNNSLEYGFAFMSAEFLSGNHTITVIVQTLNGKYYSIQSTFSKNSSNEATIYGTSVNEVISKSISLDCNGGTCDINSISAIEGYAIGQLPTPSQEGFNFLGWYDAKENGNRINSDTTLTNSLDTIYALWEEKTSDQFYTSNITLNKNAAWFMYFLNWTDDAYDIDSIYSVSSINDTLTFSHTLGTQNIDIINNKLEYGFAFNGADFINPGTYEFTVIVKTLSYEFYAIKTSFEGVNGGDAFINSTTISKCETIDINLDPNEGVIEESSIKAISNYAIGNLPTPSKEGFKFVGWYTEKDGGEKITSSTAFIESTTIYAHWIEINDESNNQLPIDASKSKVEGSGVFIYFTDNSILTGISKDDITITLNKVTTDFEGYKGYESSITYNGITHTDGCIYFTISIGLSVQDGYYFDFDFTISLISSSGEIYESNIIFRNNATYSLDGELIQ